MRYIVAEIKEDQRTDNSHMTTGLGCSATFVTFYMNVFYEVVKGWSECNIDIEMFCSLLQSLMQKIGSLL